MRKLGLFFSSLCAMAAIIAFTSIAPASAAEIPLYEKIVSNPVDFYFSQPDALVASPAIIAVGARDMSLQSASNLTTHLLPCCDRLMFRSSPNRKPWTCACLFRFPDRIWKNEKLTKLEKHSRQNGREGFSKWP